MLSISIISLLPTSLEQQTPIITSKTNGTYHTQIGVSDKLESQEYSAPTPVHDMYNKQIIDLNKRLDDSENKNTSLTYLSIVVGIIAALGGMVGGYLLSKRHLESTINKSIEKTVEKMAEVINAQLRIMGFSDKGQVSINEKGNAVSENQRSMTENVPVSDVLGAKVTRASEKNNDTSNEV